MAQYHLRVADDELHVRFPGGEERSIPLEDALTSNMLRNIVADRATDREVGIRFQPGVLETWLRCVAVERPEIITSLATDTLMEYIKACDYFVDEKHLNTLCSTLGHRLFSPPGQLPADQHEVTTEQVLASLSEDLANYVLTGAPSGSLACMLSVLPTARHQQAVLACLPSIAAHNSLSLNCELFPTATLTATLATLATQPPLHHLDVNHIPLEEYSPYHPTPTIMQAVADACMSPKHVSLEFGDGELNSKAMGTLFSALKSNASLTHLSISKPGLRTHEVFPAISLSGVERLKGLQGLTVACSHGASGRQCVRLPANLSNLTRLTALRLSGCRSQNPEGLPAAVVALQRLQVFELVGSFDGPETEIMRSAAQLPQLSDVTFGGPFGSYLGSIKFLNEFPSLRRCKLVDLKLFGDFEPDQPACHLANSLRGMPHLEDFSLTVDIFSCVTGLLPVLDALEAAGTSHSCTLLDIKAGNAPDGPEGATQVCERLQRLTNLKHLAIGGFDMLLCSNADTLLALARALRSLTHFHLRRNPGGVEPYSSAAPFLHTVLPQLTQLRFMEVNRCIIGDDAEHAALAAAIAQNRGLRHLGMHHQFSTASAKALSTLNSLTELILWRADEPDVVEEPTQQAFYTFASSLGHLTNLQVLNLAEYCLPGGFGELPESIAQLQALRHISIWYQGADAPSRRLFDWPKLLQAIGKVRGLEDLLLQGFKAFSDEAAASIAVSLAGLTNLREIKLFPTATNNDEGSTTVSCEGAAAIAEALSRLPRLRNVGMLLPNLSEAEAQRITQILRTSPTLGNGPVWAHMFLGR